MHEEKNISVLIVDQNLSHKGILTNCAFVLGLSAGRLMPSTTFGPDVIDGAGARHAALTNIGHFVRKAGQNNLRTVRETLSQEKGVTIIDYCEDAAPSDYSQYAAALGQHSGEQIIYRAIHLYGAETIILPVTRNLSRLE